MGKNPEAVLDVTGEDPRIDLTGRWRTLSPNWRRPRLAVVPLLSGSGTRIKILELGRRPAVVSTSIGAEGLEAEDGRHLMLADTPDAIRNAVSELLGSCDRREEMDSPATALRRKVHLANRVAPVGRGRIVAGCVQILSYGFRDGNIGWIEVICGPSSRARARS